ncbi:hypothetical protein GAH_02032 [Geoglobus ahangari]|uniref:Uncharacterized protein n=1 Tax=Geoglobus ahangari TaxID=113653 RepID=A0A0F7IDM3_9EURY|nr:hypothetical protein [Geoglobus ahangari]AKG90698.1 hypothetical protein GAH_02032 [Geoglobus ahangari]
MGLLDLIGKLVKVTVFLIAIVLAGLFGYYYASGVAYLPQDYYLAAKNISPNVSVHDISTLAAVLSNVSVSCGEDGLNGGEVAAYLEWYLEGAGFDTYIARSEVLNRMWLIVELDSGDRVAVEPEMLCKGSYIPPGIIDRPDGAYRNYSSTLRIYAEENPEISYEKFIANYSYYYRPPRLYENPGQMISFVNYLKYPGWKKVGIDEVDWWNSKPFSEIEPFSRWS